MKVASLFAVENYVKWNFDLKSFLTSIYFRFLKSVCRRLRRSEKIQIIINSLFACRISKPYEIEFAAEVINVVSTFQVNFQVSDQFVQYNQGSLEISLSNNFMLKQTQSCTHRTKLNVLNSSKDSSVKGESTHYFLVFHDSNARRGLVYLLQVTDSLTASPSRNL